MSIDRSWLRRGLVSPPHFGRTLPEVWLDTEVTFERTEVARDDYGGFTDSSTRSWTVLAHVRRNDGVVGPTTTGANSLVRRRRLDIRIQWPTDNDDIPKKGDYVSCTIDTGQSIRLHVEDVISPRNFGDHIHVVAEEYD